MIRMRDDEAGQIQLLEAITVAAFVFVAIAMVTVYRLPTSPQTFQESELANIARDFVEARQSRPPDAGADCNEASCPFTVEMERLLSLSLGYVGATDSGETPDTSELEEYLEGLPDGTGYQISYSNGHELVRLVPSSEPPVSTGVVVVRTFLLPNWSVYATEVSTAVRVRVNELTGFGALTTITDPLGRSQTEGGVAWTTGYGTQVPTAAIYGTHRACNGADCRYFTVTAPGVYGAGSQVLEEDRTDAATIVNLGTWAALAKYYDAASPGSFASDDHVYLDLLGVGVVSTGDFRLSQVPACRSGAACISGSYVRATDADAVAAHALNGLPGTATLRLTPADADLGEGDPLYLDISDNTQVNAGDLRMSRVGLRPLGDAIVGGDADIGDLMTTALTGPTVEVADVDSDGVADEGEAVFLNVVDMGQTGEVDPLDFYLSNVGTPSVRYAYEIQMAVWYAV